MARIADPEKMENIKRAVMECIIDYGYGGVSIALISEKAGVSPGYLYRYYKSKEELVQELADSEAEQLHKNLMSDIASSSTAYEVAKKTIKKLFMKANEDSLAARFTASAIMDLKIPAEGKKDHFKIALEMAERCIDLGKRTGEFNKNVTAMEVLVVSFTIPFRYLLFSLEIDQYKKFTDDEVEKLAKICINALK